MSEAELSGLPGDPAARIRVKRVYLAAQASDGRRVLVDRLWPRGISKERADLFAWEREIAPSDALRRWFHADLHRWEEFEVRYRQELDAMPEVVAKVAGWARDGVVTLIYAAKDEHQNHALVLQDYLCRSLQTGRGA